MNDERENIWPALLLLVAFTWMLVWLEEVDLGPVPKWLQVIVHLGFFVAIARRVWRGRLSA